MRRAAIPRVLVIGDDGRSFLSVVRSLGRHGITVDACPLDFSSAALSSRFIRRVYRLPNYAMAATGWVETLTAVLAEDPTGLVLPCDERGLLPLMRHRSSLPPVAMALPNDLAFTAFFDKLATRALAGRVGVPIAPGRRLDPDDSAAGLAAEFGLPLLLKPRRSYHPAHPTIRRDVRSCRDLAAVIGEFPEPAERTDFLVEGFFDGIGVGLSVLAHDGRILQAFQHRRVREPRHGGGSSYRVAEAVSPDLLAAVARMTAATALTGLAMFEFRRGGGGAVLLEVNARPWGSLPLAVAAGVDFPVLLHRLLVDGVEEPMAVYRVGHYGRDVAADLRCLAQRFTYDRHQGGWLPALRGAAGAAAESLRLATGRESLDVFALDDPRPALLECAAFMRRHLRWPAWPYRMAARQAVRRLRDVPRPATILMLCQGNICRSPFAASMLGEMLPAGFEVVSAGLLPIEHRPSPDVALAAAQAFDVDLTAHRSRYATDRMLAEAACIVVFDRRNARALAARGLALAAPVIYLGELLGDGRRDIADPNRGDRAVFDATYRRIARAVRSFAACLARPRLPRDCDAVTIRTLAKR